MAKRLTPEEKQCRADEKEQNRLERVKRHQEKINRDKKKRDEIDRRKRDAELKRAEKQRLKELNEEIARSKKPKNRNYYYNKYCKPQTTEWARNLDLLNKKSFGKTTKYEWVVNNLFQLEKCEFYQEWFMANPFIKKDGSLITNMSTKKGTDMGKKMEDITRIIMPILFPDCKYEPNGPNNAPDWMWKDDNENIYHIEIKSRPFSSQQATGLNFEDTITCINNIKNNETYKNDTIVVNMVYEVSDDNNWYKFSGLEIYPEDVTIKIIGGLYSTVKASTSFCMETKDLMSNEKSYSIKRDQLKNIRIGSGSTLQTEIISNMERKMKN